MIRKTETGVAPMSVYQELVRSKLMFYFLCYKKWAEDVPPFFISNCAIFLRLLVLGPFLLLHHFSTSSMIILTKQFSNSNQCFNYHVMTSCITALKLFPSYSWFAIWARPIGEQQITMEIFHFRCTRPLRRHTFSSYLETSSSV